MKAVVKLLKVKSEVLRAVGGCADALERLSEGCFGRFGGCFGGLGCITMELRCYTKMSKLVAVRIPDELLVKIDAEGKRSTVIIKRLTDSYNDPLFLPANPASSADVNAAQEASRPTHAVSCTCYSCRPPK